MVARCLAAGRTPEVSGHRPGGVCGGGAPFSALWEPRKRRFKREHKQGRRTQGCLQNSTRCRGVRSGSKTLPRGWPSAGGRRARQRARRPKGSEEVAMNAQTILVVGGTGMLGEQV